MNNMILLFFFGFSNKIGNKRFVFSKDAEQVCLVSSFQKKKKKDSFN